MWIGPSCKLLDGERAVVNVEDGEELDADARDSSGKVLPISTSSGSDQGVLRGCSPKACADRSALDEPSPT